jgi:cardiolipin synthase A/B
MVDSANFDVRSMRLNFELNTLVHDPTRAAELERVLSGDFDRSCEIVLEQFLRSSRIQRLKRKPGAPTRPAPLNATRFRED